MKLFDEFIQHLREDTSPDVFDKVMDFYRDLLLLLNQATHTVAMQPVNEFLVKNGGKRVFETTISGLGDLLKNTELYYHYLLDYRSQRMYEKGSFHNFMALEHLPKYRKMMINGLRVLHERAKNTKNAKEKQIITQFSQKLLTAINEVLGIIRDISAARSINPPFRDYVERFQLQDITTDEIIPST